MPPAALKSTPASRFRARTPRRFLPVAAVGLALFASACAGGGIAERTHGNPELERALAALASPKAPVRLNAAPGGRRELDGALLNGLDVPGVEAILGPPTLRRIDPPAQVWLYERPLCFVDLFLFDEGRGAQVIFVQERTRAVKKTPPGACLGEVWQSWRDKR